jgi:hypothetical protein
MEEEYIVKKKEERSNERNFEPIIVKQFKNNFNKLNI